MKKPYAVGTDIGGSHISTVLINLDTGKQIRSSFHEKKIDNQAPANEILDNWADCIRQTMATTKTEEIAGIGFAMPGPFDYEKGIALFKNVAKYDNLCGVNVGEALRERLSLPKEMSFRYFNNGLSFAVGESWSGKASGFNRVVAITLGTGFGSAFINNGIPLIDGETVSPQGYVYNVPYRDGIADDYFSTRWFISEYERKAGVLCKGVKEISERVPEDNAAQAIFRNFGTDLGNFLLPVLQQFEADCLVIGGNISGAFPFFGNSLEKVLQDTGLNIKIIISELMESAAMIGSARLLDNKFWRKVKSLVSKL